LRVMDSTPFVGRHSIVTEMTMIDPYPFIDLRHSIASIS
jgi:hypothetical protein